MLHMATSYYQELRNLCGTSKFAMQQGVRASTNQTIYGMFTEWLGINMLQKKWCPVLDAGLPAASKPSCSESSLSHIPHTLLAVGASETSRKQEQVMWQVMINYVEDQPSKLHPPAFPVSLLLFLPRYFSDGTVCRASRRRGRRWSRAHAAPSAASATGWRARTSAPSLS